MKPPILLKPLALSVSVVATTLILDAAGVDVQDNPSAIYLCTGPNWTGSCRYVDHDLTNEGCTAIPPAFAHAQSIGGDQGPSCSVYSYVLLGVVGGVCVGECVDRDGCVRRHSSCQGVSLDVTFPGTADASEVTGWLGMVASFACRFMYDPSNGRIRVRRRRERCMRGVVRWSDSRVPRSF